jgi:predicted dehydrogenase
MKKIGFIDHYIDEWHALNYPQMIKDSSYGDRFEVALAWEECTPEGKMPLKQYCEKFGIRKAESMEQVIEECDCLVVLSPDNVERHEDLTKLPLASGKPVYVDKPFAESLASGKRMVERAKANNTPLMSSSALRFDSTVANALNTIGGQPVNFVGTRGPGVWEIYAIHQIEPMVAIMGTGASRVMQCGTVGNQIMVIEYPDQRRGLFSQSPGFPFQFNVQYGENGTINVNDMADFFPRFIEAMLKFFDTGESQAPPDQTLEIAAILEAGTQALKTPGEWVAVPK